jgi:Glycosyl hydrolase family 95 catalytic domain/Glycoside hydrolase family 95, C-terminal domain/Domain of unknown function (DUF5703)
MEFSRRAFLGTGVASLAAAQDQPDPLRSLISQGDLIYEKPASRSEEGIPIGNGRMGTLLWTTPTSLRMQINRVDVYANNCASNSFVERHNDYCGGCAFVDIDFGGEVFPETGFRQHLSIYDGLVTIQGKGVEVHIAASPTKDCIGIEISAGHRVEASLRLLRFESKYAGNKQETQERTHVSVVTTRNHTATSQLSVRGSHMLLTQEFREGDFCCKSAVVVGPGTARVANEMEARLIAGSAILIGSAASFDATADVAALASLQLDGAAFASIVKETKAWWHAFWQRGWVRLSSKDGSAEFVAANYHYCLYLMGSSSHGKYPAKFNGMLWNTNGDQRTWGAQHWFANLSCNHEALFATNRIELLDPMFGMYFGMREAAAVAARQQWASQGIFIPETVYFDGLEKLPDDIAAEMSDLYLLKKPWEQRSARFREFASHKHPHSSRWNWILKSEWVNGEFVITERGSGPYGNVSHIMGSNAKVAYWFWRRYEYTLDLDWLRNRAYPMLKGVAEFYRNFPNMTKGEDGRYHINHVNSNESVWGARDTDEDLSAMRGVFPALLRAAEILQVDQDMQPVWREFLEHLAPIPLSTDPQALKPDGYTGPTVFVRALKPAVKGTGFLPDANSLPMWFFDLCSVESSDQARLEIASATFQSLFRNGINEKTPVSLLSKVAIAAASLGRAEDLRQLLLNQVKVVDPDRGKPLANRLGLREGPNALDAERLGRASEALQLALLQSTPPQPAGDPVIHLFPAWPKAWDGEFQLAARGAFLVKASLVAGTIRQVELTSQAGSPCRLRNPWGEGSVTLTRNGRKAESLSGSILSFSTHKGERINLQTS